PRRPRPDPRFQGARLAGDRSRLQWPGTGRGLCHAHGRRLEAQDPDLRLMSLQSTLLAVAAAALVAGGAGMQFGKWLEKGACDKRLAAVQEAAAGLIERKDAEIRVLSVEKSQAQAEVAKVNAET